jgi:predicted acyl esterase
MNRCITALAAFSLTITFASMAAARDSKPGEYSGYSKERFDGYVMTSQYVSARDGTKLAIDIFRPTKKGVVSNDKLPVLWMHTPYNRRNYRNGLTVENYPGKALQLVKYGYVVAVADFRGLYASFGHNQGFNRGEWQSSARWDAYDITEWLAKQPWSTGKIGMWGCSATGGSQMQALSTAPPSLKAIFPMSCEWDVYGFVAAGGITPPNGVPTQIVRGDAREVRDAAAVPVDGDVNKEQLTQAIAEHKDNLETAGYAPLRDSEALNFNNQWWLVSSPHTYSKTINHSKIAIYTAGNWDEGTTKYGVPFIFNNVTNPRKMIFGPATHCDWTTVLKETGFDIVIEEHRFFDFWLKGIKNGVMKEKPVTYYTYNQTPKKSWQTSKTWPLRNEKRTDFYLLPYKQMKTKKQLETEISEMGGNVSLLVDYDINDKNFFEKGLVFLTGPLEEDTQITGHPVLKLWIASNSQDADVIARIDDVAPDGSSRYYNVEGRLRASLRKTAKAPYNNLGLPWHPFTKDSVQPLKAGEPVPVEFDLLPLSYVFKEGHKIRLTLNFADARATPKQTPPTEVTVYHGGTKQSVLTLPVIPM